MHSIPDFIIPPEFCKALIFDLDGTLADTMPIHLQAWRLIGEKYGYPIVDQMILDYTGTPTIGVAKKLNETYGWKLNPEAVYDDKNEFYHQIQSQARPVRPIAEVYNLATHFRNQLPMAIGTGSTRKDAIMAIEDMEVEDWFPVMVTADEVKNGKPHPETYLKCAIGLDMDPKDCIVYEDGLMGIEAALNAGMSAINIVTQERHILNSK